MSKETKKNKKDVQAERTEEFKCEDSMEEVIEAYDEGKFTDRPSAKPIATIIASKEE